MDISTGAGLVVLAAVYLAIHLVGFAVNWMLSESELTRRLKNDRDCAFIVWWGRERERPRDKTSEEESIVNRPRR